MNANRPGIWSTSMGRNSATSPTVAAGGSTGQTQSTTTAAGPGLTKLGMDYLHVAVDDHSRLRFSPVLPDEKGPPCASSLAEAAEFFPTHRIRQVMPDNALNYPRSRDFQTTLAALQTTHILTRPHPP